MGEPPYKGNPPPKAGTNFGVFGLPLKLNKPGEGSLKCDS